MRLAFSSSMILDCPKCGVVRNGGSECARCGVIYERYKWLKASASPPLPTACQPRVWQRIPDIARRFGALRWVLLAATVIFVVLIVNESRRPHIYTDDSAAQRAQWKLEKLQLASEAGRPAFLEFDEAEVNAWLRSRVRAGAPGSTRPEASSTIREIKVKLLDDHLRAYVLFGFHGINLSLVLEGESRIDAGRLRFEPSSAKLGSLPLPQFSFRGIVGRFFDEPVNQDRFFLAHRVSNLRIDRGALIVTSN
jgi:hypothetical protein